MRTGTRANEPLNEILNAVDRTCTADTAYSTKNKAKDNVRNCYIKGVSSRIEAQQVRQKDPQDLRNTIDLVVTEEEHYKLRSRIMTRDDERVESSYLRNNK